MAGIRIRLFIFLAILFSFSLKIQAEDLVALKKQADSYFDFLRYDSAAFHYKLILSHLSPSTAPELYCEVRNKYGASLFWHDRLDEARTVCYENLKLCTDRLGANHPETAQAHINLGAVKFVAGDYGPVAEQFQLAAYIYESNFGALHPGVAKSYEWLGTYYEAQVDTLRSRKFLWKAFETWKQIRGADHTDLAEIYRYKGLYFKRFKDRDSALICFQKAKTLFDLKYGKANFHSVKCLNNMADIYMNHADLKHLTLPTFQSCFRLIAQFSSPNRFTEVMTLYNYSHFIANEGLLMEAIQHLNQALSLYYTDFEPDDIFCNPAHTERVPFLIPKIILFEKARHFSQLARLNPAKTEVYLNAIHDCSQKADKIILAIGERHFNPGDRLLFMNAHAEIYGSMANTDLKLFELTGNEYFLNSALINISKEKFRKQQSNALSHTESHQTSPGFSDKVNDLLRESNEIKARLLRNGENAQLEKRLHTLAVRLDQLYAGNNKVAGSQVSENQSKEVSLKEIQRKLKSNQCLLIYHENVVEFSQEPTSLSMIAISKNSTAIKIVAAEASFQLIASFGAILAENVMTDSLVMVGKEIYRLLIAPFDGIINQEIIILPSPRLALLPFDALPDPNRIVNKRPAWLIENHTIWKLFSIRDFLGDRNKTEYPGNDSLLAIVPVFSDEKVHEIALLTQRDSSLINLPGAAMECEMIADYFNTKLITGYEATKLKFTELSGRYPYVHISTHGVPSGNNEGTMQLAFCMSKGADDDSWMNFYEILNLKMQAGMVVLSACKTGVGRMNNGEGCLNLAWAFHQAGARSAVIGLWDVNDFASMKIMPAFYKYLKQGHSRPEALRKAKLEYIQTVDDVTGTPYYWAAFDFVGEKGRSKSYLFRINRFGEYIGLGALIISVTILLALGVFIKLRKTKSYI